MRLCHVLCRVLSKRLTECVVERQLYHEGFNEAGDVMEGVLLAQQHHHTGAVQGGTGHTPPVTVWRVCQSRPRPSTATEHVRLVPN